MRSNDDFMLPSGTTTTNVNTFGSSWSVSSAGSLFPSSLPGFSCNGPDNTYTPITCHEIPQVERSYARQCCLRVGAVGGARLCACELDVYLNNNECDDDVLEPYYPPCTKNCYGNGRCFRGVCRCRPGYYGIWCHIRVPATPAPTLPPIRNWYSHAFSLSFFLFVCITLASFSVS